MKVIITQEEAVEKGIWPEVMNMFGVDDEDEVWPAEEFILTEEQARKLKLIP
ncbi:hypothetical protein VQ056_25255 [Paenibacillus sp. JTLBN-2024]|uniref:Uncharacterized protein n=1 Tax=Paenibacillus cookii TaxID=157839 RepID=A0ABQ4LWF3_9BACL|nr:hypothetical protein [Paenibacillus cookii]KHF35076.1 hypothetical protein CM49_02663 [Paenibacillus sp. P1XP2]GIO67617.1 hypothetical protein J21TS3_24380 [Paenibacillus cookii]HWO54737.1 hypothetical protein [Paenibacillus cookii]